MAPRGMAPRRWLSALLCCCMALWMLPASAQPAYPDRAIQMIVPYPPGSGTDTIARYAAKRLEGALGKPVVVENRPGANAVIAAQTVTRANPDGYTLLWAANGPVTTNVALYDKLPYDPVKELSPVARVAYSPMGLYVAANAPYTSASQLMEALKNRPGELTYGAGSTTYQIASEWFLSLFGGKARGVSYKGAAPALTDLASGQIDFVIAEYSAGVALVHGGRLRLLATTNDRRMPADPDVPTLQELGLKSFFQVAWWGMFAPAGTPAPVVDRLQQVLLQSFDDADGRAYLKTNNYAQFAGDAAQLRQFQLSEIERERQLVTQFGIPKL